MSSITALGDVMVLLLAEPGIPLRAATTFRRSLAGAEANVAVGLSRLGHATRFVGRVGDDAFGDVILATLAADRVDVSAVARDPRPTALLVRDAVPGRPVEVLYHRLHAAGSALAVEDLPQDLEHTDLLHVTAITGLISASARAAVLTAVERARAAGVVVSVDPNLRWTLAERSRVLGVARELVNRADLVLGSDEELAELTGVPAETAMQQLLDEGARVVVERRRTRVRAATADGQVAEVGIDRVAAVDPVGAGDAFDAAFLDGWLRNRPLAAALAAGTAAGALVVGVPGDLEGLPRQGDLADAGPDVRR